MATTASQPNIDNSAEADDREQESRPPAIMVVPAAAGQPPTSDLESPFQVRKVVPPATTEERAGSPPTPVSVLRAISARWSAASSSPGR